MPVVSGEKSEHSECQLKCAYHISEEREEWQYSLKERALFQYIIHTNGISQILDFSNRVYDI